MAGEVNIRQIVSAGVWWLVLAALATGVAILLSAGPGEERLVQVQELPPASISYKPPADGIWLLTAPEGESIPESILPEPERQIEDPPAENLPVLSAKKQETHYHFMVLQTAKEHEVDPALIKAIIMAESGYNPRAESPVGARGLMQLMPLTAAALGVNDSFDPEENIKGGVRYFKELLIRFDGDLELALAAYNAGMVKVREYRGVPPYKATRTYIQKVFRFYQLYKQAAAQNPSGEAGSA